MRPLIVFVSLHHGNTKKVAEAMAAELECQALTPSQVDITGLTEYDLLGFGSGLYFGRTIEACSSLPVRCLP